MQWVCLCVSVQDQKMYEQLRESLNRWDKTRTTGLTSNRSTSLLTKVSTSTIFNNYTLNHYTDSYFYNKKFVETCLFVVKMWVVIKHTDQLLFWYRGFLLPHPETIKLFSIQPLFECTHVTDNGSTQCILTAFYCCSLSDTQIVSPQLFIVSIQHGLPGITGTQNNPTHHYNKRSYFFINLGVCKMMGFFFTCSLHTDMYLFS